MWDSKIKFVNSCGRVNTKFEVFFDQIVYHKIKYLMNRFDRLEWLGYLIGEIDYPNNKAYVKDFMIPKQTVSSVVVKDISSPIGKQYVGVIHSHHHMMNSFSGTDHEFINQNNDISILVTHKEINGQIRIKTECNCFYVIPVEIKPNFDEIIDKEFIKSIDENIMIDGTNGSKINIGLTGNKFDIREVYREKQRTSREYFGTELNTDMYEHLKKANEQSLWDDDYDEDDEEGDDRNYMVVNGRKAYVEYIDEEEEDINSYINELEKEKYGLDKKHIPFDWNKEEEEEEQEIKKKFWRT